jgi:aldehyde dehydrogenase (NAD+)
MLPSVRPASPDRGFYSRRGSITNSLKNPCLGAGVWTQSVKNAQITWPAVSAGTVWVNTYRAVSFLMPFGGYKASGLGRENGVEAIDGYLQSKSVWINGPGGGNALIMKTAG